MVVPLPHDAVTGAGRQVTLFGKLPAHGDFVSRGLAAAERDDLDQWLARSLADAHAALGDAFEDIYDQAPPWRFAVQRDGEWRAGALALSMDGVGRRYPIVLGIGELDPSDVEAAADAAEEMLYAALGGGWDADRLIEAATSHDLGDGAPAPEGDRWWTLGGGSGTGSAFLATRVPGARPPHLMRAILTLSPIGEEEVA